MAKAAVCDSRPTTPATALETSANNPTDQWRTIAASAPAWPTSPCPTPPPAGSGPPFVVPLREQGIEPHPGPDPPTAQSISASSAHARSDAAQDDQTAHDVETRLRAFVDAYAPPDWAAYASLTAEARATLLRAQRGADGLALLHPRSQERQLAAQEWRRALHHALDTWNTAHATAAAHTTQADPAAYPVLLYLTDPLALALQTEHDVAMPAARALLLQLAPTGPAPAPAGAPRPYILADPTRTRDSLTSPRQRSPNGPTTNALDPKPENSCCDPGARRGLSPARCMTRPSTPPTSS
eukprot:2111716-Pleurochrysis_carterae.AAC.2